MTGAHSRLTALYFHYSFTALASVTVVFRVLSFRSTSLSAQCSNFADRWLSSQFLDESACEEAPGSIEPQLPNFSVFQCLHRCPPYPLSLPTAIVIKIDVA